MTCVTDVQGNLISRVHIINIYLNRLYMNKSKIICDMIDIMEHKEVMPVPTKKCNGCKKDIPKSLYKLYKNGSLYPRCTDCWRIQYKNN